MKAIFLLPFLATITLACGTEPPTSQAEVDAQTLALELDTARFNAESDALFQDMFRRRKAAEKVAVRLPKKTRYDRDPQARKVYLEAYAASYRDVLAAYSATICPAKGPYLQALFDGDADGYEQARKEGLEVYVVDQLGKVYARLGIRPPEPLAHGGAEIAFLTRRMARLPGRLLHAKNGPPAEFRDLPPEP